MTSTYPTVALWIERSYSWTGLSLHESDCPVRETGRLSHELDKWWMCVCVWLTVMGSFHKRFFTPNSNLIETYLTLTHWGRDKMADISQTIMQANAFSWMKILEFRLIFHWSLLLRVKLTIFQHCRVQIMAWCRSGDKPLSEPMVVSLQTHIWVTQPQWVKFSQSDRYILVVSLLTHIWVTQPQWVKFSQSDRYIFCAWHDSTTVVSCAKFYSDHLIMVWMISSKIL